MPRPGRELEQLVARLQHGLARYPVTVESPAFVTGADSGEPREVDVAVRGMVGDVSLLVVFECRDRRRVQGVEWIDSIYGKLRDVHASKIVAVSSSGFTGGAKRSAAARGFELRTVDAIGPTAIRSWLGFTELTVKLPKFGHIHFDYQVPEDMPPLLPEVQAALADDVWSLYFVDQNGARLAVNVAVDLCYRVAFANSEFMRAAAETEDGLQVAFPMSTPENAVLGLDTIEGPSPLMGLEMRTVATVEAHRVPMSRIRRQRTGDGDWVEAVEFDVNQGGEEQIVAIYRDKAGALNCNMFSKETSQPIEFEVRLHQR